MRRKSTKDYSGEFSENKRNADNNDEEEIQGIGRGDKKSSDEYKCGKPQCGKLYHSYTAFYNHCKKSHDGVFPSNSIHNNKNFEGPSKNRGRPRIKKTDAKDSIQIESLKTENELIQFLGTLPKKKKNQELIVFVANPPQQLQKAIEIMRDFSKGKFDKVDQNFVEELLELNKIVSTNDLPDFYDPIEIADYGDKMDSYNFLSIYNFLTNDSRVNMLGSSQNAIPFMRKIIVVWLTRILSIPLLADVVDAVAQMNKESEKIEEREYMAGKTNKFRQLIQKYFKCILKEQQNLKCFANDEE